MGSVHFESYYLHYLPFSFVNQYVIPADEIADKIIAKITHTLLLSTEIGASYVSFLVFIKNFKIKNVDLCTDPKKLDN